MSTRSSLLFVQTDRLEFHLFYDVVDEHFHLDMTDRTKDIYSSISVIVTKSMAKAIILAFGSLDPDANIEDLDKCQ